MNEVESRLGRALLLRFDAGRPLTALSPAWAALSGMIVSGGLRLDVQTLVLAVLLLLLVEPVMGGLWELAADGNAVANVPAAPSATLPYTRPGSAGYRLAAVVAAWQAHGWETVAGLVTFVFALALGVVLGQALYGVLAALVIVIARLRWRTGVIGRLLQSIYDLALPWLMGMVALRSLSESGLPLYRTGLVLATIYTVAYLACVALADDRGLPALAVLDLAQAAVLAMLLNQHQTLAVWIFGLCLVGQVAAHAQGVSGGRGAAYLRRSAAYIVVGMLVAAIALAPRLAGT